ncbi:MAG: Outer membrane protein assembly factor BamB [Verrucomicrobia subdivision 3 bacterium]|nr:Outer membrane protein assembly factor BamB [Limisphaerales bacterium]MCS1412913.1 Outer membrane protein assembly factor BamB [Limisphaerales bacterium]
MKRIVFVGLIGLSCLTALAQTNWPQFRGLSAFGLGEDGKGLPDTWDEKKNVAWKTSVPGLGWSSPVVWGNQIFFTTVVSEGEVEPPKKGLYFGGDRPEPPKAIHHWKVLCYDFESGALVWNTELKSGAPSSSVHLKNTFASETPATDGERVYVYFGYQGLYCLDFSGKVLWKKTWDPYKTRLGWGTSASPVLYKDRVFIVNDNMEGKSYIAAFNKYTGEEVWRQARDEPSNFSTPFIWENDQRTEIVTTGVNKTRSYDLGGKLLWEFGGMSTICIPTPFAADGLLYVCAGYVGDRLPINKPVYAIRAGASGDISLEEGKRESEFIVWRETNSAPYNPSPLFYKGRFYVLWDFGFLSCRDAVTGAEIYDKQRVNPQGRVAFTVSPWAYDDKIFCLSEDGDTYVFQAGADFKLLNVNPLKEMCMASPAIVRGSLIIRSNKHLYRIKDHPVTKL